MYFNRQIIYNLKQWKVKSNRKPLVLRGARQVGKTTVVKEFAKEYTQFISLNLERPEDIKYFKIYDNAKTIIDALFVANNLKTNKKQNTLLFIDEIQESPEAIALLRYFYEDVPKLHVIAAGSLLEHVMDRVKSFPVGRIEYLHLHPLNFAEYLQAKKQIAALDQLQTIPVPQFAHTPLMKLFHEYAIIGGMPEVLGLYLKTSNLADLSSVYESIWLTYKDDVEKYANNATERRVIKHILATAHLYLDQRIKFENFGKSNYRSREVGEALRNLDDAKIIQLIYPTTDLSPPIKPNLKKAPKLQFLDTGLVNYDLKLQAEMLSLTDLNAAFRGAIIPHLIIQEIISLQTTSYKKPNFWVRNSAQASSEVDLILTHKSMLIPIEVKAGKEGTLRSLHQFVERGEHPYAVRLYAGIFKIEKHYTPQAKKPYLLMNLPYYLGTKLREYISYFVDEYTL